MYPNAVIQRCLVHVKRQIKSYLSSNPKLTQSKELLAFSRQITSLKTAEQANYWLIELGQWYRGNQEFIEELALNEETGRWWYRHKSLHQAWSHLALSLPHLFSYINDEEIPYSSNQLEGYFTHLKEKLIIHKGLRFEKKKNFIKWYIHFINQKAK